MSLGYYSPTVSGPVAKYSGDISSWTWTQSGQTARSYSFAYDGAHRLTAGQYYSGSTSTNALSEKGISYDRNGNITALTRYNASGTATALTYAYTGNYRSTFSYDASGPPSTATGPCCASSAASPSPGSRTTPAPPA